jgi:L-serine dehydratase
MRPYFKTSEQVNLYVPEAVRLEENTEAARTVQKAREEVREMARSANPIAHAFGDAVVGGSSIAVGSPTNMGRIAHGLFKGEIRRISIELTTDLFARRAINVPGILMGAVLGASTSDIGAYNRVLAEVSRQGIEINLSRVDEPEVQRISIEATEQNASINALNRGGARIKLIDARPSLQEATMVAEKLGIKLAAS